MMRHDPVIYLMHMRDYAAAVSGFAEGRARGDLDEDTQFAYAVRYGIGMLGEAASRVPRDLQTELPEIAWSAIIGMRHRLIHGYEDVDYDIVWYAVQHDIPELVTKLDVLIEQLRDGSRERA
jgi:uncharacterized protein with HEPN domain